MRSDCPVMKRLHEVGRGAEKFHRFHCCSLSSFSCELFHHLSMVSLLHAVGCAQAASAAKVAADAVRDAKPAAESAKQDAKQAARETAAAVQEAAPAAPKEAAKEAGGDFLSMLSAAVQDAKPTAPKVEAPPLLFTPVLADVVTETSGKSAVQPLRSLGPPGSQPLRVLFGLLRRLNESLRGTCACKHADSHI